MRILLFLSLLGGLASAPLWGQEERQERGERTHEEHQGMSRAEEAKLFPGAGFLSPMQVTVGYDYISPDIHPRLEEVTLKGFQVALGMERTLPRNFSTTSKPSFSYNGGSENYFFGVRSDHEINTKILRFGQSLNYNFPTDAITYQPFIEVGLGYGWWHSEVTTPVGTADYTGNNVLVDLAFGLNLKMNNGLMPFVKVALRNFEIDEYEEERGNTITKHKLVGADEYDFGGTNWLLGLGYIF